jgi:CRP/FNR family transcriptional regulator, cyclic AMP receptor protein
MSPESEGKMSAHSLFINAPDHTSYTAGQTIYQEGEAGTHMYGVVSGAVELRKGSVVVATLGPNDVFGERALIDHRPRHLTAVATEYTELAEIDQKLFLFLVHESPTFALGIMGALSERLHAYDDAITD